jgi:hypothetical protein
MYRKIAKKNIYIWDLILTSAWGGKGTVEGWF